MRNTLASVLEPGGYPVGLDTFSEVFIGYDDAVEEANPSTCEPLMKGSSFERRRVWTPAECIALADEMLARWTRYREIAAARLTTAADLPQDHKRGGKGQ